MSTPRNTRRTRQHVLERDHYECQLRYRGCTWAATEVHHQHSITERELRRADTTHPDDCVAACRNCRTKMIERQRQAGQIRMNAARRARQKARTP